MKKLIRSALEKAGYEISKIRQEPIDLSGEKDFLRIYKKCQPYTMTSVERMYALHNAVKYIVSNQIPGDLIECGVWRGGSSMNIALTLLQLGKTDVDLWLYDTYTGMSAPSDHDVSIAGESAAPTFHENEKETHNEWCFASLEEVKRNLLSTGYPESKIHFVKGKVEETVPGDRMPKNIALLRLDTDWFESTFHEMTHFFPRVSQNGIVLIDDYGHWKGAKEAVDQYFQENRMNYLLSRIDYTGRLLIKTNPPSP